MHGSWEEHEKYRWIESTFLHDPEIIPVREKVLSAREAVTDRSVGHD